MIPSRLILNGINGRYPREIPDNAIHDCELVEAAVAYASQERLLFDWCWKHRIPLKFWGRFDETIPVSPRILKLFLDRRSANFTCKLLPHFHAKVIWWHGVGAYVGSANLSDAAWHNNVEAGCFFDEGEMVASGVDVQLSTFFRRIDANATPLSEELYKAIDARAKELNRISEQDREARRRFLQTSSVKQWNGLLGEAPKVAAERQRQAFLNEWFETLQILRDIGTRISADGNRPIWLPADVPSGAQADQFLHAHYFNRVIGEDRRSHFAEQFEVNRTDPEHALTDTVEWWRDQSEPPSGEARMLFEWAPVLRRELSPERILNLTEEDFEGVCSRVWAIQDHGRRVSNATLNLPNGTRHSMETKTKALAGYLFERRAPNGANVLEAIHHVLYGGSLDDLPLRLWEATLEGPWRIEHLGISALGELVGWALPDRFPPRNNRTSKSLRSLGFPVDVHG
jgi:hypothetical protein